MTFAAPLALIALAALPLLWWLLRVTPPSPRRETFPAIRLLLGLNPTEETPARTPWWLLLLRLIAAGLVIVALARPVLDSSGSMEGRGPVLLVIDNGWAAAPDWPRRVQMANTVLDRAARAGRKVALLTTAAGETGAVPKASAPMPVADIRALLGAARPEPWPSARAAAIPRAWPRDGTSVVYIADGLMDGSDFADFEKSLAAIGPVTEICCAATPKLLPPPETEASGMTVRVTRAAGDAAETATVLARSGDGRTLARVDILLAAGNTTGSASLSLPLEVRNRIGQLVLDGPPSAGSVVLLDERWRRRPVGMLTTDLTAADAPLTGALFYPRRALAPFAELRDGDLATLLRGELSVLILSDRVLASRPELTALTAWVEKGGLLIRFAGPRLAETSPPDTLLPVPLLSGDRQLGGAMSWSEPAGLAPFPAASPFAGMAVPPEVRVTRQVLAEPGAELASHTWALLADGTPLVTRRAMGAGQIVLFHVTSNADWSNLPLSGLFVDLLNRLVALSAGVTSAADATVLAPAESLDGFGRLGRPPEAAQGLEAGAFATTPVSPRHPPGLYGPENGRRALNLGSAAPALALAPRVGGATVEPLSETPRERELGPPVLAVATLLLVVDLVLALGLRGLLRRSVAAMFVLALMLPAARASEPSSNPALTTRLGYIASGDPQVDAIAALGLTGLSEYVNRRTAAALAKPDAVEPGRTDLSGYPLLYWPITADASAPTAEQAAALNAYMAHGGIILIDTRESGSGAGFAPGTDRALKRVARDLSIPPLAPLTPEHVLARAFYLLSDFPGRFTGEQVWVQRDQDRANDSVSPVIIGGHDWASAWAVDDKGRNPYAVIPGGQRQRTLAYRFGVNLVMYALTGNYKGDQVHIPAILQRLGQ
ncbi:MAG: DUF4159 domain-containing protein [Acetobacteraceae bacterium]|nr:DUF4159 domain-containing protein [Acetobacteraceae bacterium]